MATRVSVNSYYADRTHSTIEIVPTPADPTDLGDWWEDVIFPLTGDGLGSREYAIYNAIILKSDKPGLVGQIHEWDG